MPTLQLFGNVKLIADSTIEHLISQIFQRGIIVSGDKSSKKKFFKKAAVNPECCLEMAKKYGWESRGWELTQDPTLKVDCRFLGEEILFVELWHDNQE